MLSLLEELYDEGLSLWVEGDALKLEFGEEAPPPDLIQQLKEKKAQLIAFLKSHQIWDVEDFESLFDDEEIPDAEEENGIEAIFPATSLQQGFIYHHISEPEDDAYRVQMLFDFHHALDIAAFQEAWRAASQQFPILRTAFDWEGEVLQIITRSPSIDAEKFTFVDLRAMNAEERARKVLEVQQQDRAKPFDLTEPGLLRITLMQQAEDLYTVLLSIHHAITDGWSSAILWQTVFAHYTRIQQGLPPEIKIDTAYPATQAFYQQQKSATKSYWDERRGTYPPANNVSALLTHDVDLSQIKAVEAPVEQRFILVGDDYFALKKMCQQESVTLNVAIQFAWHKILKIFSGDKQTIVGTTVSGRDVPIEGIESSVGLYINTLPLLVDWSLPAQSVRATLQAIQQDIADLNTHSSISLAGLNSESDRLFNSLFVFESYPMPESDGSADEALGRVVFRGSVEKVDYPLSLTVYEENNSLVINLGHSEAWLSVEGANNILQKLAMLLRQMTGDPTQPCAQLTILDDSERHQILTEFNPPELSYPAEQSLQNLVEDQVVAGPDRVALVFGKEQLTYAQLNAKANQLAHEIRATYQARYSKPMPTGTIVGLYFKRSLELVIATLAIVKAGGAYLPLSVSYPKERVGFLLEDTGTDVVLTSAEHKAELTSLCHELNLGPDLLDITDLLEHSQASTANLSVGNSPQDLLYVIYTSGTTGKPKGVLTPHQGVVSLVMNNPYVMVSPKDVFLFLSDISFDAATFEMWAPLTHGATLVVSQTDAHSSVEQMRDLLFGDSTGFEVSILFITKALFDALYLQDEAIFSRLHTLLTGGEVASVAVFRKLLSQPGGPTRLLNV